MARSYTRAQLRTMVRQQADQESIGFVADSELDNYLEHERAEIYELLAHYGYYNAEQALTAATTALPAAYGKTLAVEYVNGDSYIPLKPIGAHERYQYSGGSGQATAYYLAAGNIILLPTPSGGSYRHTYVPAPTPLTDDTSSFDGVMGYESAVIYGACMRCALKENDRQMAMFYKGLKDEQIERIVMNAPRDLNYGGRVNMVSGWDEILPGGFPRYGGV